MGVFQGWLRRSIYTRKYPNKMAGLAVRQPAVKRSFEGPEKGGLWGRLEPGEVGRDQ